MFLSWSIWATQVSKTALDKGQNPEPEAPGSLWQTERKLEALIFKQFSVFSNFIQKKEESKKKVSRSDFVLFYTRQGQVV